MHVKFSKVTQGCKRVKKCFLLLIFCDLKLSSWDLLWQDTHPAYYIIIYFFVNCLPSQLSI